MTTTRVRQPEVADHIDPRVRIAALWIATLFIFAYVDLFSLYRPDVRADLEAGRLFVFDIGQAFLFFTTLYVVVPSVMIYLTLVMPRGVNRALNVVLPALYLVTIVGSAVGEWNYFILGSVVEAALLGALIHHAWTWRRPVASPSSGPGERLRTSAASDQRR